MSMDGEFTNGPDGVTTGVREAASPRVSPARESTGQRDESAFRSRSTVLLASWLVPVTPPMRMPDGIWALMITEVTVHCSRDRADAVDWFFGYWLPGDTPAHRYRDGDVVLRLFEAPRHTRHDSKGITGGCRHAAAFSGRLAASRAVARAT